MPKKTTSGTCWAYMVQCKYGTFYAGWTNDIKKRISAHNDGTGAKYLRGKGPVKLVYKKKFLTAQEAQKHERMLKKLKRKEKEIVILRSDNSNTNVRKQLLDFDI